MLVGYPLETTRHPLGEREREKSESRHPRSSQQPLSESPGRTEIQTVHCVHDKEDGKLKTRDAEFFRFSWMVESPMPPQRFRRRWAGGRSVSEEVARTSNFTDFVSDVERFRKFMCQYLAGKESVVPTREGESCIIIAKELSPSVDSLVNVIISLYIEVCVTSSCDGLKWARTYVYHGLETSLAHASVAGRDACPAQFDADTCPHVVPRGNATDVPPQIQTPNAKCAR
jgi:hypothetical protein